MQKIHVSVIFQNFSAMFEAIIDGLSPNQARGKTLTFEISGDGNLPRISITKPTVRNKRGQPLLLFKRNLVGRSESLPLVLLNDGTLPSKVKTANFKPIFALIIEVKNNREVLVRLWWRKNSVRFCYDSTPVPILETDIGCMPPSTYFSGSVVTK